jgi:hypothetical protein
MAQAERFAGNVLPILLELRASGARGYGSMASVLNQRGIRTARGRRWHVSTVRNVLARSPKAEALKVGLMRERSQPVHSDAGWGGSTL